MKNEIASKLYYSISEVAQYTGVKAHVLRYWESEFPTLRPKKARNGARRYRRNDIDEVLAIRQLLYEEGFKIAGARKVLRQNKLTRKNDRSAAAPQMALGFDEMSHEERLQKLRDELRDVLKLLREMKPTDAAPTPPKSKKGTG